MCILHIYALKEGDNMTYYMENVDEEKVKKIKEIVSKTSFLEIDCENPICAGYIWILVNERYGLVSKDTLKKFSKYDYMICNIGSRLSIAVDIESKLR